MCFEVDFVPHPLPVWRGQMMGAEDGPACSPSQWEVLLSWPRTLDVTQGSLSLRGCKDLTTVSQSGGGSWELVCRVCRSPW